MAEKPEYVLDCRDSGHIVGLESIETLSKAPYTLKNGEQLNVGDEFVALGRRRNGASSAGFAPIVMKAGWRQRMEGTICVKSIGPPSTQHEDTILVLMSAWNEEGQSALADYKMKYPHVYFAYAALENGNLHFTSMACASRLVVTDHIERCSAA